MANPQLEDGYLKIANELFDAIAKIVISNASMRVFLAIMRRTYGFNKKEDEISLSQIRKATGLKKDHYVTRAVKDLIKRNMITTSLGSSTSSGRGRIRKYRINKDFETWRDTTSSGSVATSLGENHLPNQVDTKDNIQKTYNTPPAAEFENQERVNADDELAKARELDTPRRRACINAIALWLHRQFNISLDKARLKAPPILNRCECYSPSPAEMEWVLGNKYDHCESQQHVLNLMKKKGDDLGAEFSDARRAVNKHEPKGIREVDPC